MGCGGQLQQAQPTRHTCVYAVDVDVAAPKHGESTAEPVHGQPGASRAVRRAPCSL